MEKVFENDCNESRRDLLKKAYVAPAIVALGSMTLTTNLSGSSSLQNNGWGNGDQTAPGHSLPNNDAENNLHGKYHNKFGSPNPN